MIEASAPLPLVGVRVLDLAGEAGALATRILADLGAEVILLEPPGGGSVRALRPFLDDQPGPERGYRHLYLNAGKRSLVVDDRFDPGAARALAQSAQLLVETPPTSEQGGPTSLADRLVEANPDLIRVAITPFGPYSQDRSGWRSTDLVAAAAGGLLAISGQRTNPPTRGPANPAFTMASLSAASGAMIALLSRVRGNRADAPRVDVSLQEAVSFAVMQTSNPNTWTWRREVPRRPAMSAVYQCADGRWVVAAAPQRRLAEFISLLEDAGIEHQLDPDNWQLVHSGDRGLWQYLENPLQYAARDLAATMPRDRFLTQMWELGATAMPVLDFPEMARTDHYIENEQFRSVPHPALGVDLSFVRSPVDGVRPDVPTPAPELGADQSLLDELTPPRPSRSPTREAPEPLRKPLAGLRVVDLCWVIAGPLGTRLLANFGAEVIKVESEARPDSLRNQPLPGLRYHPDLPDMFNDANTGKRSLLLDLTKEEGRDLLLELIAASDVVTDNFRAGALARMGFPYERLREVNRGIVVAHLPGPGSTGPWADRRTLGPHLLAASGLNYLMGFEGDPPHNMGIAYPDFTSPLLLVSQVLAALYRRESTGEGCEIDLSQLSATVSLLGAEWMRYAHTGQQPPRGGNRHANYAPHGVFRARGEDDWCALAVEDDQQWRRLAELIDGPVLANDSRFATLQARKANEDELEAIVQAWTAGKDRWELAATLQELGIPAAPVEDLRDMLERDPVMAEHYQRVRQPSDRDLEIVIDRDPVWISGHDRELTRAPMRGEHSEYVIREILGRSSEEFDALVMSRIVF